MSSTVKRAPDGASPRQVEKFERRREELAQAALTTLAELGYARTSLREIAQNSEFSHGVLHYYFTDKVDLITHCVRRYKAVRVARYDAIAAVAGDAGTLVTTFTRALQSSLTDDGRLHRLWYELRAQALYEPGFRADVADIDHSLEQLVGRVVTRIAQLQGVALPVPGRFFYALVDGLFQRALLRHLSGEPDAVDRLGADVTRVLHRIAPGAAAA